MREVLFNYKFKDTNQTTFILWLQMENYLCSAPMILTTHKINMDTRVNMLESTTCTVVPLLKDTL